MSKKNIVTRKDIDKLFKGKDDITLPALSALAFHLGMVCRVTLHPADPDPQTTEREEEVEHA